MTRRKPLDSSLRVLVSSRLHLFLQHRLSLRLEFIPRLPLGILVRLRDAVAETATNNGMFNNVTDKEKQELYELLILIGGLTYHFYEKACKENNAKEIENCKLSAANNLKIIGVKQR